MTGKSIANPDALEGKLYLSTGEVKPWAFVPSALDNRYIDRAIDEALQAEAEGNVPVGAVLVSPKGVWSGHSTEIQDSNPWHHAEFNAYHMPNKQEDGSITSCYETHGLDLSSVIAYTTLEPCPSCGNVFVQGHLGALIMGATYKDAPREYFRQKEWDFNKLLTESGRQILVVEGLKKAKALELLRQDNKVHKSGAVIEGQHPSRSSRRKR